MRHYGSVGGRVLLAVMLCLALVFAASCGKPSIKKTAEAMVDSMAKGDFKAASADFDATVAAQMPAEKLGQVWASLAPQIGAFKSRTGTREAEEQGFKMVYVTCQFEKMSLDAKIVFDASDKVSGLWFLPTPSVPGGK